MPTLRHYGAPHVRKPSAVRHKAIDRQTQSALATHLARAVAHANAGHWGRAAESARMLVHTLKANGINPNEPKETLT